jgi:hypothetical protein
MKAIPKVDANGLYIEDELADDLVSGLLPLFDEDKKAYAYLVTVPIVGTFFRPRFDVQAWMNYDTAVTKALSDYNKAMANWYANGSVGEKPELKTPSWPPNLWTEGLTQAEIDELLKQGEQSPSEIEELRQLVADLYETLASGGI